MTTRSISGMTRAFSRTWTRSGLPPSRRNCFGNGRPMRLPTPPASTIIPIFMRTSGASACSDEPVAARSCVFQSVRETVDRSHPAIIRDWTWRPRVTLDRARSVCAPGDRPAHPRAGGPNQMSGIVLTIRIVLVRVAYAYARHLPLRRRVVLATAHSPVLAGNLAAIADDLAARYPEIRVVTIAHRPATGARGRIGAAWQAVVAAYHLATA